MRYSSGVLAKSGELILLVPVTGQAASSVKTAFQLADEIFSVSLLERLAQRQKIQGNVYALRI